MNLFKFFRKKTKNEVERHLIIFDEKDEIKINEIILNLKLNFSFINNYANELFLFTANLFNDDIIEMQKSFVVKATKEIKESIEMLTKMDGDFHPNSFTIKEINFKSHFYKYELENYINLIIDKKTYGINLFKDYDIHIEAAERFINIQEISIKDKNSLDPYEIHTKQEKLKDIERFKEKVNKLRTNKLYHSQTLAQMSVLNATNERLYDQVKEIIFILIPVIKNKTSISNSILQLNKIKEMVSLWGLKNAINYNVIYVIYLFYVFFRIVFIYKIKV